MFEVIPGFRHTGMLGGTLLSRFKSLSIGVVLFVAAAICLLATMAGKSWAATDSTGQHVNTVDGVSSQGWNDWQALIFVFIFMLLIAFILRAWRNESARRKRNRGMP